MMLFVVGPDSMTFKKNRKKLRHAKRPKFLLFDPGLSGEFKNFSEVRRTISRFVLRVLIFCYFSIKGKVGLVIPWRINYLYLP